jgi:DNA uptake protein ComE-like DNA-binding protein
MKRAWQGTLVGCVGLTLGIASPGCSAEDSIGQGADHHTEQRNRWAVDMKKVDELYGRSSSYFLGITSAESALPPGLPGGDQVIWDQTFRKEADGSAHVETGTDYAVIDRDGKRIDPVGYVNLVPMLKDTDPAQQVHIKEMLRDGDVLVYFHPEYVGNPKDMMERRSSHVAMHYEHVTASGVELVHHIDNPNSYGPRYNHPPNRHMPFHVFRFQPRTDKAFTAGSASGSVEVEGVAFSKNQRDGVLALVNEASVEKLDQELALDARAAEAIVSRREATGPFANLDDVASLPYVGPSALAKLRDSVGGDGAEDSFTISNETAQAYGHAARNWAFITNDLSPFADFFTLNLQTKEDLPAFATAAIQGQQIPEVYCSGLAYTNLNLALNFPLNKGGLGALWPTFEGASYAFSDANESYGAAQLAVSEELRSIDRLVFEPYAATDILNEWVAVYLGNLPAPVRAQLLQTPQLQQMIVQGMSQLEWSDETAPEKQQSASLPPATLENVKRWADAYGKGADETAAFLAADPALKEAFESLGISAEGLTPMDVVQAVEHEVIANKFVPPRIWLDEADKLDSDLIYVATVLNCELLSPLDGGEDACALGGGGVSSFKEGAADTSTYPHYKVDDKGERTHRRFDATPGPELAGPDSAVTVRASHASVGDMVFLLHVPAHHDGHPTTSLPMMEYDGLCTQSIAEGKSCAPALGIKLDVQKLGEASGPIDDVTYRFRLGDVCQFDEADPTSMLCPVLRRGESGELEETSEAVSTKSRGLWAATMVDRGGDQAALEIRNCASCNAGGGHFNQWVLSIE